MHPETGSDASNSIDLQLLGSIGNLRRFGIIAPVCDRGHCEEFAQ